MDTKPRVVYVLRWVMHWRAPVFQELEKRNNFDISVIHSSGYLDEIGRPTTKEYICKNSIIVKGFQIKLSSLKLILQPGALIMIMRNKYEAVFCEGGRSILTNVLILLWCKYRHIPFYWWTGSWEPQVHPAKLDIFLKKYMRFLWRRADGAIVYNEEAQKKVIEAGMPREKVFIAQNTRDERTVLERKSFWISKAKELREQLNIDPKDKVVLYVGTLVAEKQVDKLLKAFYKCTYNHSNWHLVIVGNGPSKNDLELFCVKNNISKVTFTGRVVEQIYAYFTMCDVFVLPGLGGLAINDSMMCGKPVICGRADGTEEDLIIDDETGYLVSSEGDLLVDEIAEKLELTLGKNAFLGKEEGIIHHYLRIASFTNMIDTLERAIAVNLRLTIKARFCYLQIP